MNTTNDLVFTEEITYINTPCPGWCTLPTLHPVDNLDGPESRAFRMHGGPSFGDYLHAAAAEYVDAPGVLEFDIMLDAEDAPSLTAAGVICGATALGALCTVSEQLEGTT